MKSIGSAGLEWYRVGTVNITQGSNIITGTGTQWETIGLKVGDMFTVNGAQWYEIVSIESNTVLTLYGLFQEASGNAQNYAIIRNFAATLNAELAARVALLVNKYENLLDSLSKDTVGLGNVDNTSDADKSVASAAKLTTARLITLAKQITGSVAFDGSGDVQLDAELGGIVLPESVDLNTVLKSGFYCIQNSVTHGPTQFIPSFSQMIVSCVGDTALHSKPLCA